MMKPIRSNLIFGSVLILGACATTTDYQGRFGAWLDIEKVDRYNIPIDGGGAEGIGIDDPEGDTAHLGFFADKKFEQKFNHIFKGNNGSDVADAVFKHHCRNGKQYRPLKTKIRALVGKSLDGIPVDAAQRIQAHKKDLIHYYLRSFYVHSSKLSKESLIQSKRSVVIYDVNLEDHVRRNKNLRVSCTSPLYGYQNYLNPWLKGKADYRKSLIGQNECHGLTLVSFDGSQPLALSFTGVSYIRKFIKHDTPRYTGQESDVFVTTATVSPSGRKVSAIRFDAGDPPKEYIGVPVFPLYTVETHYLTKYYTMLIPKEVQEQIFKNKSSYSKHYKNFRLYEDFGPYFVNRDETFNISEAVQHKDRLWSDYMDVATEVKEAQTSDPLVINYEVGLNLDLLCKYGRSTDDLISR